MTTRGGGLGLDGCAGGWVAVHIVDGTGVVGAGVVATVAQACERFAAAAVAIDMPIGLDDAPPRPADAAARRLLGRRAPSVFPAPPRCVVDAYQRGEVADHAAANALCRAVAGHGLSRQSWGLVSKVAEVDAFVRQARLPVVEAHPEVQFRLLAGGGLPPKTSWSGFAVRQRLLFEVGVLAPEDLPGGERVAADDVLDAAAVAWAAAGLAAGQMLRSFPDDPPRGRDGRLVAIWARQPVLPAPSAPMRPS